MLLLTGIATTFARRAHPHRLLALLAAAPLLGPGSALALTVYGSPRALPGAGGCLRESPLEPDGDQVCAGGVIGLTGAQAVAVSPDGATVYVAAAGDVVALARARAGGGLRPALWPSSRACVAAAASGACASRDSALSGADALAVSPDGRFIYVGAANTATVSAFARTPRGLPVPLTRSVLGPAHGSHRSVRYFGCVAGVPLAGVPPARCQARVRALNGVTALAISPDGRNLYAVSYGLEPGADSVVTLQRDPGSGRLRPLAGAGGCVQSRPGSGCPALAGLEGASAITISRDGRFVYVASELSGAIRGFLRNRTSGALTPLPGHRGCVSAESAAADDLPCAVKVPQLAGARSIALSPDGRELYAAAFEPGAVVVLRRDPKSGALAVAPPSCLQAAPDTRCRQVLPFLRGAAALAVSPDGVVYVVSEGGNSLVELLRNPADGSLAPASDRAAALDPLNGPAALALASRGQSIYVVSPFDGGVAGFAR